MCFFFWKLQSHILLNSKKKILAAVNILCLLFGRTNIQIFGKLTKRLKES